MADEFPLAYPGSTWGRLVHDNDTVGGNGVQWNVVQGVELYKFPSDIVLNAYGALNHRSRENNALYYNSEGPSGGIELRKGPVSLGYEYFKERLPKLQRTSINKAYYAKGFFDWAFLYKQDKRKFPGSFWFLATNDISGLNGSGVQFFLNQGIMLHEFNNGVDLVAYAEYDYRSRDKNQKYYDSNGPAVGVEARYSSFNAGIDYFWESLPHLNEYSARFQIYFSWFTTWDMKDYTKSRPKKIKKKTVMVKEKLLPSEPKIKKSAVKETKTVKLKKESATDLPPDKKATEIKIAVDNWLTAWNVEDISRYASFYSSGFISATGMSKKRYINRKRRLFKRTSVQLISISKRSLYLDDSHATTVFFQDYRSARFKNKKWINQSDKGWKKLYWVKENGEWKITSEIWNKKESLINSKIQTVHKPKRRLLKKKPEPLPLPVKLGKTKKSYSINSKENIEKLVDAWLIKWNEKDINAFAKFYSADFLSAKGENRNKFISRKRGVLRKLGSPNLSISNFKTSLDSEKADVLFLQSPTAGGRGESGWKRLVWIKYGSEWKIIYERFSKEKIPVNF